MGTRRDEKMAWYENDLVMVGAVVLLPILAYVLYMGVALLTGFRG